jgi:peptidoglycan glycosyltransferase
VSTVTALGRRRRNHELGLGVHAIAIVVGAYILLALASGPHLPPETPIILAATAGLYLVAHLALRRFAPNADGTIIPIVATLNGLGFVAISRLVRDSDIKSVHHLATVQATWTALGVAIFVATLAIVRDPRMLVRYRYTSAFVGGLLLLLPLVPHPIGETINGARIWAKLGPISFQPGELAKVLLVIFFAGYLVDRRELLAEGTRKFGPIRVPAFRHLAPLLAVWALSILVLVAEQDLGSSLLLFSVFVAMLFVATNRPIYLGGSAVLFGAGALFAYKLVSHVRVRVDTWIDPWHQAQTGGYQIIQSWYAFAAGGLSGRGLGLGSPDKVPVAVSDFILAAIGEELGLLGTIAVVLLFLLLVGAGLRAAIDHPDPFAKLLATGLTVIIGVQAFVIIGGVTRLIPLTGVTLPFVSYGGSSLIGNFILIALLARVSDGASLAQHLPQPAAPVRVAAWDGAS